MAYTNSSLVSHTKISPNRTSGRTHAIDTITIHCVVGQCTVEALGRHFANPKLSASSNYGVGYDGRIGMYVEEKDRSWCSSSSANDNRAITIEVASDTKKPYAVNDKALAALIELVADICKRNGIKELKWKNDKSLIGQVDKQNMTIHRWFANTSCPGDYLYNKHSYIAEKVNEKLGVVATTPSHTPPTSDSTSPISEFKKGDVVKVTGNKYYNGKAVPSFVKNNTWIVHSVSGDRVVVNKSSDGKHSIMSPFNANALALVSASTTESEATTKPTTSTSENVIKSGTVVSIAKGAKYYNGLSVPNWVINKNWIVKGNPTGDRVVIDKSEDGKSSIYSAISSKYLTVVSNGGTTTAATTIKKGSKVRVKDGAKTYIGGGLASFVYKTTYTVLEEPRGDRVVIGTGNTVIAAVNKKDLIVV